MDLAESKIVRRAVYQPGASSIEGLPTALEMFHAHPPVMLMPHWHVQVEVNYIMQGSVHYRMNGQKISMKAGDMCLFWGGQPHQMDDCSEDAMYAGGHLPLVYFFRMRLPINISSRLMKGEILFTSATDTADFENFPRGFATPSPAILPSRSTPSRRCCYGWSESHLNRIRCFRHSGRRMLMISSSAIRNRRAAWRACATSSP